MLAAPAVRRRARLSGAIRPATGANSSGPGPAGSWRIRGSGGKGGALSPGDGATSEMGSDHQT
ncbi:hypothetical protein HVIM_04000 [Roseomonas mucosa]|nr:hypothetical protein HVIM_04000 [Roseomonas mucosa]QDD98565.1 hypothetical protein ADP8_04000 [Roseomonas mucosa]